MHRTASVAIIGAGPRGVAVLERLAAHLSADEGLAGPLVIHLVDPYPPGGGKVWRFDQSPLLRLNSMAGDVTLFTDHTVTCAGPIRPGPTMAQWAQLVDPASLPTPELRAEASEVTPITFPTRRLGGEYLAFVFRQAVASLPADVELRVHAATAVDLTEAVDDDGSVMQVVHLDDGSAPLCVDAVVLTLGHLDTDERRVAPETDALAAHAERHGLAYLPPAYGTEADLSVFGAGSDVIVRGFGLGFVDLLVLLTEGRGGRFDDDGDGHVRYTPSGDEPRFHIGSRRGVPYRAKLTYDLVAPKPPFPRFFQRDAINDLVERVTAEGRAVDFRVDVWPLIAKEIAWASYHELALGHPDRVTVSWVELEAVLTPLTWGTAAWDAAIAAVVPDPADRLDFEALDRPLDGMRFDDADAVQRHLVEHIRADIDRRADQRFSADLGAFDAFLAVFAQLPAILGSPKLSPRSRRDFDDWWFGFFSYYASGPPPRRLEELLALAEAGVVRFLGAETWVRADDEAGTFLAGSASAPGTVSAKALIDARLPGPSVAATRSALVQALAARGEVVEQIYAERDGTPVPTGQIKLSMPDQRLVDASGAAHPRRFALGQHSTSRAPAFARPLTNSLALRHNDVCAREVVAVLRAATGAPAEVNA